MKLKKTRDAMIGECMKIFKINGKEADKLIQIWIDGGIIIESGDYLIETSDSEEKSFFINQIYKKILKRSNPREF